MPQIKPGNTREYAPGDFFPLIYGTSAKRVGHKSIGKNKSPSKRGYIEYFMESARIRWLHTSCGVSEIEHVSEANK